MSNKRPGLSDARETFVYLCLGFFNFLTSIIIIAKNQTKKNNPALTTQDSVNFISITSITFKSKYNFCDEDKAMSNQLNFSLNNRCMKSLQILSFFWSVFSCVQPEYRKIRTRKNAVFRNLSRSEFLHNQP